MALSSKFVNSENISIGINVHIGPGATLDGTGGITLGDCSILRPDVCVYSRSHNFDEDLQALPFDSVILLAPVTIGRYVWIGTKVIVLPGVCIGDGAVVGAGAVVSKDIPSCAVVVGNPARVVRYRDIDRFSKLMEEDHPFVYQKLGHDKVMRPRKRRAK